MKGTIWRHRKGGIYIVLGVATGCERNKQGIEDVKMVVYQSDDLEKRLYVRAKSEFLDGRFSRMTPSEYAGLPEPSALPPKESQ
jgi:hypothetical protein